jgi:hypothetical protein
MDNGSWRSDWLVDQNLVAVEERTLVVQEGMEQALGSHQLWAIVIAIKCNYNNSINKSNHPIQNPSLLATEHDNIMVYTIRSFLQITEYITHS